MRTRVSSIGYCGLSDFEMLAIFDDDYLDPSNYLDSEYQLDPMIEQLNEQNSQQNEIHSGNNSPTDLESLERHLLNHNGTYTNNFTSTEQEITVTVEVSELNDRLSVQNSENDETNPTTPMLSDDEKKTVNSNINVFALPKTYACYYCSKLFYNKIKAHHHHVCHTKKMLRCNYCPRRTRSNSGMSRHLGYHHGFKQSSCYRLID